MDIDQIEKIVADFREAKELRGKYIADPHSAEAKERDERYTELRKKWGDFLLNLCEISWKDGAWYAVEHPEKFKEDGEDGD